MNMIETVARTLWQCTKNNGGVVRGTADDGWRDFVYDAREVIASIREPTDEMLAVIDPSGERENYFVPDVQDAWRRMIDGALESAR